MKSLSITAIILIITAASLAATPVIIEPEAISINLPTEWNWFTAGSGAYERDEGMIILTEPPVAGYGNAGLWTSIPTADYMTGDILLIMWDFSVEKSQSDWDRLKTTTRLIVYEPDFVRVEEHHVHGFDLAENNYRTAYTLNAPVPDCIYLRIDHLSSENSQVNDLVELTEVRCTRLRLKGFIGTP